MRQSLQILIQPLWTQWHPSLYIWTLNIQKHIKNHMWCTAGYKIRHLIQILTRVLKGCELLPSPARQLERGASLTSASLLPILGWTANWTLSHSLYTLLVHYTCLQNIYKYNGLDMCVMYLRVGFLLIPSHPPSLICALCSVHLNDFSLSLLPRVASFLFRADYSSGEETFRLCRASSVLNAAAETEQLLTLALVHVTCRRAERRTLGLIHHVFTRAAGHR